MRPSLAPLMESAERQAAAAKKANEQNAKNEQTNGHSDSLKNAKKKILPAPILPSIPVSSSPSPSNAAQTTILQIGGITIF